MSGTQEEYVVASSLPPPPSPAVHSPRSVLLPSPFRLWLFFAAVVVGSNFAMQMLSAPVYLHFAEVLNDCDRLQASEYVCLDSSSGHCLWIDSRCYFPDYLAVNCSDAIRNSTSSSSANMTLAQQKEYCANHSASGVCRFDEARQQCRHYAGWADEVSSKAIFTSSTTMGGVFGPILFGAVIVPRFGYTVSLSLCACCSLLSAVLLTAGIESGEFVLWALPRAVGSISSYVTSYFLSHVISATIIDDADVPNKEEVKVFAVRTMGVTVGCVAFLESLYLYLVAPSRAPEDFEIRSDPQLKMLLHVFNISQYLIAAGLFWFAWMVHLELEATHLEQEARKAETTEEDSSRNDHEMVAKIEHGNEDDEQQQSREQHTKEVVEEPEEEDCCRRDNFLAYLGGLVLTPLIMNLSGLAALTVFAPDIVRDVIRDPLLAQLCSVALPMPIAAVCGFLLVIRYSPLNVLLVCAVFTEVGTLIVGIAVWEGSDGAPLLSGSSAQSRATIAFVGLTLFSFSFICGAGTLVFAALSQIYSQEGRNLERLRSGSMWSSLALGTMQTAFRFMYPYVADSIGVGQTLVYGFALFGLLAVVAMFVSQKMRSKEDSPFEENPE